MAKKMTLAQRRICEDYGKVRWLPQKESPTKTNTNAAKKAPKKSK